MISATKLNETKNTVSYIIDDGKNVDTMYVFKKSPKPYRLTTTCDEDLYKKLALIVENHSLEKFYPDTVVAHV